jgi:uncharacterized OsmC-like protein
MSESTDDLKTIAITGHSQGAQSTSVDAEQSEFVIGKEASPLEYLLGSLAACINVIGHLVAKDHDIVLRNLDVDVEGDIDTARYMGEDTEPRAGFQVIRVRTTVDADTDDQAALQAWMDEVAERCPVADNLRNTSDVEVSVEQA